MQFEDIFPPIDPESAGTVEIPQSLASLKDRDLAQRLATRHYGVNLSADPKDESLAVLEVLDEIQMNINGKTHSVAAVKVRDKNIFGRSFSFVDVFCSHDLIFALDERFLDENGNPVYSGRSSLMEIKCPIKSFANDMKAFKIREEYKNDEELYEPSWRSWKPNSFEKIIPDLIKRFENDEWIGNTIPSMLFLQDIERILDSNYETIDRVVRLLSEDGKLIRDGNTVYSGSRDNANKPSRLWAVYSEGSSERNIFNLEVFLPASLNERQQAYVKIYKNLQLFDILIFPFYEEIQGHGEPSKKDLKTLKRLLATKAANWRKPYVSSSELELLFTGNDDFVNDGVDPETPSDLVQTLTRDNCYIKVYLPASDEERQDAYVVVAKDEEVRKESIRLLHSPIFGVDVDDNRAIEDLIEKLVKEFD